MDHGFITLHESENKRDSSTIMEYVTSFRKSECLLRIFTIILLVLAVCLLVYNAQTKALFYQINIKATYKYLNALVVAVWVHCACAIYNFLQLGRCIFFTRSDSGPTRAIINGTSKPSSQQLTIASICFILDQVVTYVVLAVNSAGIEASFMGITGSSNFQWMKLCDRYTRFCFQAGGALLCGLVTCILMIVITSISAYNLFRHFSPNKLLVLKAN